MNLLLNPANNPVLLGEVNKHLVVLEKLSGRLGHKNVVTGLNGELGNGGVGGVGSEDW